ncbi:MAG: orotate phosphoribosyltransferase [Propionibacteriaceae bacterium]|jgi:orotate phosphoribosyltransferase|nr:orotate phosphoribosyltransferase [Propionibacteriaceae bacterium]
MEAVAPEGSHDPEATINRSAAVSDASPPLAGTGEDRRTLAEAVRRHAVVWGRITLASGREADYYVDLRRITFSGSAAPVMGRVMLDLLDGWEVDAVGGLTLGADPVATAILHAAAAQRRTIDAFTVRKEAKAHGLQRRIEGPDIAGRRVVVVEDTSTTGGSIAQAVAAVREAGATVVGVAVVVDRATGARERFEREGLEYRAALGLADIGLASDAESSGDELDARR